MRADDVLRWLVKTTGLEPKLLSVTAIVLVYVVTMILYVREKANEKAYDGGDLSSKIDRVETGVETIAKYLVNLDDDGSRKREGFVIPLPVLPREALPRIEQPEPEQPDESTPQRNVLEEVVKMSRKAGRST